MVTRGRGRAEDVDRLSANRQSDVGADPRDDSSGIITLRAAGVLDEERIRAICADLRGLIEAKGCAFLLVNFSDAVSIAASGRKAVLDEFRDVRLDAAGVVGASFHIRVLSILITKALQTFTKRSHPLSFFDTEAEARAWLLEQRRARGH